MTTVRIPKGHPIYVSTYASTTLTESAKDFTVDATVLPPVRVKLASVSKVDGSLRPAKQEPSAYICGELVRRYGTSHVTALIEEGYTEQTGNDITIEVQPWLAWWRTGNETRTAELNGPIEDYVPCVRVAVDGVGSKDFHTTTLYSGGVTIDLPRLEVFGVAGDPTVEGGVLVQLEESTAARLGWT
jgi:hypothetical protein